MPAYATALVASCTQPAHHGVGVVGSVDGRPSHEGVGARSRATLDGVDGDAAVQLDGDVLADGVDELTGAGDLGQHRFDELLPAETGLHRHQEHVVELLQDIRPPLNGSGRLEHQAGTRPKPAELAGKTDGCPGGLTVEAHGRRARLDVGRSPTVGVLDHQVHVKGEIGAAVDGLDDRNSDGQVRHEVIVHHVDVNCVAAGNSLDVALQVDEVGGKDAGSDAHGHTLILGRRLKDRVATKPGTLRRCRGAAATAG